MDNVVSWNIWGLNSPNKQEDLKLFLYSNKVGLIGLLETKIILHKVDNIANKVFMGWQWQHNFHLNSKGRIWLAWKPSAYHLEILKVTDQLIHGKALQYNSNKQFYITMVYGMNQASQRQELWDDLQNLAPRSEAWSIMGDFNAVLRWKDRIGGDIVTEHELMELKPLLEACELHEVHTMDPIILGQTRQFGAGWIEFS